MEALVELKRVKITNPFALFKGAKLQAYDKFYLSDTDERIHFVGWEEQRLVFEDDHGKRHSFDRGSSSHIDIAVSDTMYRKMREFEYLSQLCDFVDQLDDLRKSVIETMRVIRQDGHYENVEKEFERIRGILESKGDSVMNKGHPRWEECQESLDEWQRNHPLWERYQEAIRDWEREYSGCNCCVNPPCSACENHPGDFEVWVELEEEGLAK